MKNLRKHLMTTASKLAIRPILTGVFFDSELNRMIATDSHRLLAINYEGEIETNKVVNLDTMKEIEGKYPNVNNLMPKFKNKTHFKGSDIDSMHVKKLTKNKKNMVKMTFREDHVQMDIVESRTHNIIDHLPPILVDENDITEGLVVYFLCEYLRDAFSFLSDFDKHNEEKSKIIINISSEIKPVVFTTAEEDFHYLVTPIRIS